MANIYNSTVLCSFRIEIAYLRHILNIINHTIKGIELPLDPMSSNEEKKDGTGCRALFSFDYYVISILISI